MSFPRQDACIAACATSRPVRPIGALAALLERTDIWTGERLAVAGESLTTAYPALDAELPGGGWPRGALVDVMHERPGIGELALLLPALAALTQKDEWVLLLAPPQPVFAPAWRAAGVNLARLIVIDPQQGPARLINNDLLWSAEQVLRAGSVAAALLWLPRSTDSAQLRRLQLAAETGGTLAFLLQDARRLAAASPAPLRLRLEAGRGDDGDGALLVHLVKRRGAPLDRPIRLPGVGVKSATKTGGPIGSPADEVRLPAGRNADAGPRESTVAVNRFQAAIVGARNPLPAAPHGKPLAAG